MGSKEPVKGPWWVVGGWGLENVDDEKEEIR